MLLNQRKIQQRFEGFLQTQCLWFGNTIFSLEQFSIEENSSKIVGYIDENKRLGKYVEELVFYQLQQSEKIEILSKNTQIQRDKLTVGEIDCLLTLNKNPIHLEIVYKFYVYDETVGSSEIDHFIGPNRKDSLIEKLTKLKEKQLPLLYSEECKSYLSDLYLDVKSITQQVYFKAQLFLPYSNQQIKLSVLNEGCIVGYYINNFELVQFKNCKFFVPTKKDWLLMPHQNVNWLNFEEFKAIIDKNVKNKYSLLCWIKKPNGIIDKAFVVWW